MILGVDPGIHGAIALVGKRLDYGKVSVADLPILRVGTSTANTRVDLDLPALHNLLTDYVLFANHIFIEKVGAMPKQGLTSTFRFGYAAGLIHGLAHSTKTPITFVTPQMWRRTMGVTGTGKDAVRARASELYPESAWQFARVKDEHRADATLIAAYGAYALAGAA